MRRQGAVRLLTHFEETEMLKVFVPYLYFAYVKRKLFSKWTCASV